MQSVGSKVRKIKAGNPMLECGAGEQGMTVEGACGASLRVGGGANTASNAQRLAELQHDWHPLGFDVAEIALIWREGDKPFAVDRTVALGADEDGKLADELPPV